MNPSIKTRGLIVALSVIGAGVIHLAAVRSHIGSPAAVASFVGIGLVQILLGASFLFAGADRLKRIVLVGVGGLAIVGWLVSRTWGLPAVGGHTGPESVGAADVAAAALQVMAVVLVLMPVRTPRTDRPTQISSAWMALPVLAVSAVASLSLLSVPPHGHAPHDTQPRAAYVGGATLIKRSVPVPAMDPTPVSTPSPDAAAGHEDAPGAPAHGH